jgi:hypothetical protein
VLHRLVYRLMRLRIADPIYFRDLMNTYTIIWKDNPCRAPAQISQLQVADLGTAQRLPHERTQKQPTV